jgi:hypothetical protein
MNAAKCNDAARRNVQKYEIIFENNAVTLSAADGEAAPRLDAPFLR